MNKKNERERSSDSCNNNDHQTNRTKRRKLEGSSIDAFDAKESKLKNLPSKCLQHILSFMTYEKMSQMRQVCRVFNEIGKTILNNGHRELEGRLIRAMERAEKRVFFPTNAKSSYDLHHCLDSLREAIHDCAATYSFHVDYFVAGKLLDEANCFLRDFNSSTTLPYFQEYVCDEMPHPLLGLIIAQCKRANHHFYRKIHHYRYRYVIPNGTVDYLSQKCLEARAHIEQNKTRILKTNLLENLKRKIECGNKLNREFLKSISKLNQNVLDLNLQANKVDQKVERIINGIDVSMSATKRSPHNNGLLKLFTPFNKQLRTKKVMRIPSLKRPNLATLPSSVIQNIVQCFNCEKTAQLRIVCKSFNEACKKVLNQEFEQLKRKLDFQIKLLEKIYVSDSIISIYEINIMKDLSQCLQLCKDTYKWHLGTDYYFLAGKVLDETKLIYKRFDSDFDDAYYSMFHVMDVFNKALTHFKFNIVPKYFPSTLKKVYVPDFIITGKEESQLNLEEIEMLVEDAELKIKSQNDRNRKFINIFGLMKKSVHLKNNVLKELNKIQNL